MLKLTYKWVIDGNPFAVQLMHAERLDVEGKTLDHLHVRELEKRLRDEGYVAYPDEIIAEIGEPRENLWLAIQVNHYMEHTEPRTVKQIAETAQLIRIEDPEPEPEKPSVVGWVIFAIVVGAVVALCAM